MEIAELPEVPKLKKFLGTKIVQAEPCIGYQGKPFNENNLYPDAALFEDGYKVIYEDGYTSWSPKEVFEKAYRLIDNMTFGLAIEALKKGKQVARKGWNGKKMWLSYVNETQYWITPFPHILNDTPENLLPWIGMKTADNKFVPWLASQTDILAEDWCIVE